MTRRLLKMFHPTGIAKDYGKELVQIVARIRPAFRPLEVELPKLLASAHASMRVRMDAGESKRIRQLAQQAKSRIAATIRPRQIEALADKYARTTSTHHRVQIGRVMSQAMGADVLGKEPNLRPYMEAFAHANVQLIQGVTDKVAHDIESAALRAVQSGTLHKDLAEELEEKYGYAPERARAIARDQVGKLYGQLNGVRQQAMGVSKYIWRTVNDERVRPEHEEREGEVFSWDDPPEDGHPGEAINCRCYAEPIFDLGSEDSDGDEAPVDTDDGEESESDEDDEDGD